MGLPAASPDIVAQGLNTLAPVDRFHGHQNPHLGRNLNHGRLHNARLNPDRSGMVVPFRWMVTLPRADSHSITHSESPGVGGAINSTNSGGAASSSARPAGWCKLLDQYHSLVYSSRSVRAVWYTPCCRASAAASTHSASGRRPRRLCVLRQCYRRCCRSSTSFGTAAALPRLIDLTSSGR